MKKLPLAYMRACEDCTVCCTVVGIQELNKPPHVPCTNLASKGCGIYETRPPVCAGFDCLWRLNQMAQKDRPDLLGVMFAPTRGPTPFTGEVEVQAYEIAPDAFSRADVVEAA